MCSWNTPTKNDRKGSNISMKKYQPSPIVGVRSGIVRLESRSQKSVARLGPRARGTHMTPYTLYRYSDPPVIQCESPSSVNRCATKANVVMRAELRLDVFGALVLASTRVRGGRRSAGYSERWVAIERENAVERKEPGRSDQYLAAMNGM
jgi:hypothetical protein